MTSNHEMIIRKLFFHRIRVSGSWAVPNVNQKPCHGEEQEEKETELGVKR